MITKYPKWVLRLASLTAVFALVMSNAGLASARILFQNNPVYEIESTSLQLNSTDGDSVAVFTVDGDGYLTVGEGTKTTAISTSDWDISAAGAMTNIDSVANDSANLTLSTTTSGDVSLDSVDSVAIDGAEAAADAVAITASTAGGGIDINANTGGLTLDSLGVFSIDGVGASNVTTDTGALTLSTTTSGDLNVTAASSAVITGAEAAVDAITLTASDGAGGIDMNAGTGGATLDTTGAFSIDGAAASNMTVATDGDAEDLTISVTGATDSSVVVSSSGTGTDAVDINATAGGVTVDATGGISLDAGGASNFTTSDDDLTVTTGTADFIVDSNDWNVTAAGNANFVGTLAADDLDSNTATTLLLGKSTATKVEIADTGVETEVQGTLNVLEATTLDGAVTLGNAADDVITVTGTLAGASPLILEGVTGNEFETTIATIDPTADQIVTIPNDTGTVLLDTTAAAELAGWDQNSADDFVWTWDYDYGDLINTPSFVGWDTDVSDDFSGSYNDLTDVPANIDEDSTDDLLNSGDTATGVYDFTGATFAGASPIVLEGGTADDFETTIAVTDPLQDNTITLPDASGTVMLSSTLPNVDQLRFTPEYPNAVYDPGADTGKLETENDGAEGPNYKWTTEALADKTMTIRTRFKLPADFADSNDMTLRYRTSNATVGDNAVGLEMYNITDTASCASSGTDEFSADWATLTLAEATIEAGCAGLGAGDLIEVRVTLLADNTNTGWAKAGYVDYSYDN